MSFQRTHWYLFFGWLGRIHLWVDSQWAFQGFFHGNWSAYVFTAWPNVDNLSFIPKWVFAPTFQIVCHGVHNSHLRCLNASGSLGFKVTLWLLSFVPKAVLCQCSFKPEFGSFSYLHSFICIYSSAFIFINSFCHWVNKYLLRSCSVPGQALGAGEDRWLRQTEAAFLPWQPQPLVKDGQEASKEDAEAEKTEKKGSQLTGSLTGLIQWSGKDNGRIAVDLWKKERCGEVDRLWRILLRIRAMKEDREIGH